MTLALSKLNFRDLGGLPTVDGMTVRSGLLYRSEGPASFFDDHRAELAELGFRAVCDLRSDVERDVAPNDWCGPGCRVLNLDMNTDLRAQGKDVWNSLKDDASPENAKRVMSENYRMMPVALQPHFPVMVDALLDGDTPMMVHCTAGKDRTGVAIALILGLLGVSRDDIVTDYARSDVFGQNMRVAGSVEDGFMKSFGFVPAEPVITMLIGAERDFITATLDHVAGQWGTAASYFEASGVGAARQDALRALMLETH